MGAFIGEFRNEAHPTRTSATMCVELFEGFAVRDCGTRTHEPVPALASFAVRVLRSRPPCPAPSPAIWDSGSAGGADVAGGADRVDAEDNSAHATPRRGSPPGPPKPPLGSAARVARRRAGPAPRQSRLQEGEVVL